MGFRAVDGAEVDPVLFGVAVGFPTHSARDWPSRYSMTRLACTYQ
jgi:hypothetical protein